MQSAPLPKDETQRLETLKLYEVLDTEAEQCFDDITQLAAVICGTPISLVSLVDDDRQWFKSKVGLDASETSRDIAFCAHTILNEQIFEIEDTEQDARFVDNPLVTGEPKIRFYAGAPLKAPNGQAIGSLCAISDQPTKLNDEQKLALEILAKQVIAQLELRMKIKALEKLGKAKDEFLSTISHELRTPLNAITGFSEILKNAPEVQTLPAEQVNYIENIDFSGQQLLEIVNSVLDLEKIYAGKMELKPQTVVLDTFLKRIINMLSVKAKQGGLTLHSDIDNDLCGRAFYLDKTKLSQIISNIVSNAIKFTPKGKKVNVRFALIDEQLHIEVADQGVGISKKDQELLFDKYKQVGMQSKEGTGLGLCITKGLVELMAGTIKLSSTLKKGTVVTITLPIEACSSTTLAPTPQQTQFDNVRVCVVEDNPLNQMLIKAVLQQLGCQFTIFDDAEALLSKASLQSFDIFLLDINLPGMSGIEALKQLKSQGVSKPKIAVTADVFQEKELNALFDDVITKPYQKSDIVQMLARHLGAEEQSQ